MIRKALPFVLAYFSEIDSLVPICGNIIPANPKEHGILFANEIDEFYMLEFWTNLRTPIKQHVYLSFEKGNWGIGQVVHHGFFPMSTQFLDWLKNVIVNDYFTINADINNEELDNLGLSGN